MYHPSRRVYLFCLSILGTDVLLNDGEDDQEEGREAQQIKSSLTLDGPAKNADKRLVERQQEKGDRKADEKPIAGARPEPEEEYSGNHVGHRHGAGQESRDSAHWSKSQMKPKMRTPVPAVEAMRRGI